MLSVLTVCCADDVADCEVMASLTSAKYCVLLFHVKITNFRVAYLMRESNTAHSLICTGFVWGRTDVHLRRKKEQCNGQYYITRSSIIWSVYINSSFIVPLSSSTVVPKVCHADPKGSATGSQGIRGYISVMTTLKYTYFLIEGMITC
jgi:hypothetical protein